MVKNGDIIGYSDSWNLGNETNFSDSSRKVSKQQQLLKDQQSAGVPVNMCKDCGRFFKKKHSHCPAKKENRKEKKKEKRKLKKKDKRRRKKEEKRKLDNNRKDKSDKKKRKEGERKKQRGSWTSYITVKIKNYYLDY